jgi:hypothetical protein
LLFGVIFAAFRHTGREPFQSRSHTCLPVNDNAGREEWSFGLESRLAHEAPLPAECIDSVRYHLTGRASGKILFPR